MPLQARAKKKQRAKIRYQRFNVVRLTRAAQQRMNALFQKQRVNSKYVEIQIMLQLERNRY
jgi:hypothetical protein